MDNNNGDNPQHLPSSKRLITAKPSFIERGKRIKMAAELGLVRSSNNRHWSRALHRRLTRSTKNKNQHTKTQTPAPEKLSSANSTVSEEDYEIESRVRCLQRLVPGGDELGVEILFDETADYIEKLQGQVKVMRALAGLLDGWII